MMSISVNGILFALLRDSICDDAVDVPSQADLQPSVLQELYKLSKQHDVAHLAYRGLEKQGLLENGETVAKFCKQQMLAIYRCQRIEYELSRICQSLAEAQIPFIPLKGSVLRKYYPEAWMRTSCDIDVLVHESDLERAIDCLVTQRNYINQGRDYHDVSLFSAGGVHLELHFDLVEDEYANEARKVLSKVWEAVSPKAGYRYCFEMTDEMFYFYHIAHMAKHFEFGGCGIRPFLDLWILDHRVQYDQSARTRLLEEGNLRIFAEQSRKLSAVWFSNAQPDDVCIQMQEYILNGGVYGTLENRVAVQQKRSGGKLGYIISRVFLSYDSLKVLYPILQNHRRLMPFMQVHRWFRLLFKGRLKSSLHELNVNKSISQERISETAELLTKLGLQ